MAHSSGDTEIDAPTVLAAEAVRLSQDRAATSTASAAKKRLRKEYLAGLVKRIVDSVPHTQWHGVTRRGQAVGQLGKPVVRQGGAIVYR